MPVKKTTKTKTVAAYVRVSTAGQNLASQKKEIQKYLDSKGLEATFYIDKKTGDNLNRPAFKRLQKDVFAGSIKTIIVYKLDRISRSLKDGITTLIEWIESNIAVVSVTQQLDFRGATGRLVASVLFAVAEMEQETRRERQAAGIANAKEQNKYKGGSPGYRKGKPYRAVRLREKGNTIKEIAQSMGVSTMTVSRYLKQAQEKQTTN